MQSSVASSSSSMVSPSRCLWKTNHDSQKEKSKEKNEDAATSVENDKDETYESVLQRFSVDPPPPQSLGALCGNSLVVGQEFALTSLFWARHRVVALEQEQQAAKTTLNHHNHNIDNTTTVMDGDEWQQRMIHSQLLALLALIVIAIFTNSRFAPRVQSTRQKVQQRVSDAILFALLLRMLASVLRTLTASFSSDTVEYLTVAGMMIHWWTCDYAYANAATSSIMENATTRSKPVAASETATTTTKSTNYIKRQPQSQDQTQSHKDDSNVYTNTIMHHQKQRPTFQGGTVSLNAAFFFTTLLASRLSSNATVYVFVSSAIILFAFFPAARHAISHHPHKVWIHSFVTIIISWSTFYLLISVQERWVYSVMLGMICGVAPLWRFWLQRYKRRISGPWDVVSVPEMMLDY